MDAVGQLTGGIAHDFNNLMQIVIGNLSVLSHFSRRSKRCARELAQKAMSAAQQRGRFSRKRLLAFARRQPLRPSRSTSMSWSSGMSDLLRRALGETVVIETQFRRGAVADRSGSQPARKHDSEPGSQCPRRDARWRQAHDRDSECRDRGIARPLRAVELKPGSYVIVVRVGYRAWHG